MSLFRRGHRASSASVLVVLVAAPAILTLPSDAGPPAAAQEPVGTRALDTERIAYAGTNHRSLGVVTDPDPQQPRGSAPLFGPGPAHYDYEPDASNGRLVFTSRRDEQTPQVYLRETDGSIIRLTSGRDAAHPELSPDGRVVVFDSAEPNAAGTGTQRDLWVIGTDGTGLRRLTDTDANETQPTVSAEGGRVAFTSPDLDPEQGTEIYLLPIAGGQVLRVTTEPTGSAIEPNWNPVNDDVNRERLAYTYDEDGDLADATDQSVRVIRCDAGVPSGTPVLGGQRADWQSRQAAWLPDGSQLLLVSRNVVDAGFPEPLGEADRVYRLDAADPLPSTATPELLLDEDRFADSPAWLTGDGPPRLVLARSSAASGNVASLQDIRSDGTDPRDLGLSVLAEDPAAAQDNNRLFDPAPGFDPWTVRQAYSPDGTRIAVSRFETIDGRRVQRIWVADADGSNAAPVPVADRAAGDWETDVAWSPDGTSLAIARRSPGAPNREGGPSRIVVVRADTGEVLMRLSNPDPETAEEDDTQPAFSPDGSLLAFTRGTVAGGPDGEPRDQRVFLTRTGTLDQQRDITAEVCGGPCSVTDDSPSFTPDGGSITFNRENDGLLRYALDDGGCTVLLPRTPGASCAGPITAAEGPFQPRDVSYSPDGATLALSSRRAADPNAAEALSVLDPASGSVRGLTTGLAGRQKEPSWQVLVDVAISAPPTAGPATVGAPVEVPATITNNGPAPAPASTVSLAPGGGVSLNSLSSPRGGCAAQELRCELGTLAPGQSVTVTATLSGGLAGTGTVDWTAGSSVLDADLGDNDARTTVTVRPLPGEPPPPAQPAPPAPPPGQGGPNIGPALSAAPGIELSASRNPAYVGGRTVLLYRISNPGQRLATGMRVRFGLPAGVPVAGLPPGCSAAGCLIGDLGPGGSTLLQVVLAPDAPGRVPVRARLSTTGSDADRTDNADRLLLDIRQPRIVAVPPIGKPGFVTTVRGVDFPPGTPVRLTWRPGITAAAAPTRPAADGRFAGQLLILTKDQTGPRRITASGPGFGPVRTRFLVVAGQFSPPDLVTRR